MLEKDKDKNKELFHKLRSSLLNIDPVNFCETYLTLDGKPFRLHNNGYKPFSDIYRYIGIKALEENSKPVILVKGRQVGATTMASALEMYFMGSGLFGVEGKAPIRVIHAFPQLELAEAYSKTKLSQMIMSSMPMEDTDKRLGKPKSIMQSLLDPTSATNDSLRFKQFIGGNHLWIESTGLNADRIIGRTADVIFFDESQKITSQAMGNALKILFTAKYGKQSKGVQIFFGTPRRKGSDYYKMWMASSQQYYYLGCENCKKHFPLYTPESDDWEKIWLYEYVVKCTHCNHEQDKRLAAERGKWVALKDHDDEDCKMIGFHINQLYMPHITKENILNEKPGSHPVNTERVFQNEVLGEFFQGDTSPITIEEIRENCADVERKFRARITPGEEQIVVLGVDYGQRADLEQLADPEHNKSGQSYSTAVVLAAKGPGLLSIEFATKFKRNDMESKKSLIDQIMRNYSIQLAIGDIGYSNDFSFMMHSAYGDRYIVSRAHNKINDHIKYNQDAFPKELIFERDYYIGEMYEQMKKGQIRFPFGAYEQVAWLIEHCTNMEIKPSISRSGADPTVHYVKAGPNDGAMALLNAYLAYKFLVTKAFTLKNPISQEHQFIHKNKVLAVTGYISRRM